MPFKTVDESSLDIKNVINIPKIINKVSIAVERRESVNVAEKPTKNIVIIEIKAGNLPLHGTKLLVRIAINLSRGESIILQPTIPAALQPNPIQVVRACFPQARQHLNGLSRL